MLESFYSDNDTFTIFMWGTIVYVSSFRIVGDIGINFEAISDSMALIPDERKEIIENIEAEVMFNEIEGGFYGIEVITTDGGKKYLPINIQLELERMIL